MPSKIFSFLKPLALEIWILAAIAYAIVSLTMWIVARFSPCEWREPTLCEDCLAKKYETLYGRCIHLHIGNPTNSNESSIQENEECLCEHKNVLLGDDEIEFVPDPCSSHEHDDEIATLDVLENSFTASNSFWFAIGSLMQQESDLNPKV
ncbi:hypothetical protein Trydic_g16537 [Trypoxylus dichotomus]